MGSIFAGVKAGTLSGIAYIGSMALFNVILLYYFRSEVYSLISEHSSQFCTPVAGSSTISTADCFSSVIVVYVPYVAFIGFFLSLLYAGVFGRVYEHLPGRSPEVKGVVIALVVLANLLIFNLTGIPFSRTAEVALTVFSAAATVGYGVMLGKLYRRYTRSVEFVSEEERLLRIIVDGKDLTGRRMTFATSSSHTVRASTAEDGEFRGWATSGGVAVEDSRSYETTLEIEGDGLLKARAAVKQNR